MLGDHLPDEVEIGGVAFPINTDFRAGIRFSAAAQDKDLTAGEITEIGLFLFFGEDYMPLLWAFREQAIDAMLFYYSCGKGNPASAGNEHGERHIRAYDFNQDAEYILAEFLLSAGIDLETAPLHWWKFIALFERLCTNTQYAKIIEYRMADTRDMSKETAKVYKRMKQVYALEGGRARVITKEEHEAGMKKRADEIFKRAHSTPINGRA